MAYWPGGAREVTIDDAKRAVGELVLHLQVWRLMLYYRLVVEAFSVGS